jgi:hypothetical protein
MNSEEAILTFFVAVLLCCGAVGLWKLIWWLGNKVFLPPVLPKPHEQCERKHYRVGEDVK